MSEAKMRIFCLFPEGRDLKRAMVSHWEGERADTLGCCRGWLHRHSGYRSWKPGWGKRQRIQPIWLIALPGNMERPVRVPPFISAQDTHQDRLRRAAHALWVLQTNFIGHPLSASTRPSRQLAQPGKARLPQA